jgi:hypothetical protein
MAAMTRWIVFAICLLSCGSAVAARVSIAPIPDVVRTDYFVVTINGHSSPVVHAASSYYLLNFDLDASAIISIRAADAHYWDRGVEIQPMRYGIRPVHAGATITFRIPGPVKLSVTRPGDHFADADMLFLLGSPPDESHITAKTAGIRYYGPGVHQEQIEAQSGDHIYLAAGAVVFGSLNLWQVHDVRVEGRGMIVYDGPQDPAGDEGWMHKRGWHCIVMDQTRNVEIDGITCVVRSRTWQIQMRDSRATGFYNVNVIGGFSRDANQDGMDWLGGGDATVRNCFIRASDDDFAMEGNWDGYTDAEMRLPGLDVTNITIEDTVASTSISNTLRVAWPKKTFRSAHIAMRTLDVIHTGFGGCVVPFAFFELWADEAAVGAHTDFKFSNIRLEDFYSLMQIRYPNPEVRGVNFSNIAAMDGVGMVPSVLQGDVAGVVMDGVRVTGKIAAKDADIPLEVSGGAAEPEYRAGPTDASFDYAPSHGVGWVRPRQAVTFRVIAPAAGWKYQWLFGDGTGPGSHAEGAVVRHAFPDTQGTLLDGSGRFRVLLHATHAPDHDSDGEVWVSRGVVVESKVVAAASAPETSTPGIERVDVGRATEYDGWVRIPSDGGYTLTLLTSRKATLRVDDLPPVESPELRIQVCGSMGDAVQPVRLSAALAAGLHRIQIDLDPGVENESGGNLGSGSPMLVWEGPGILPEAVPTVEFVHAAAAAH